MAERVSDEHDGCDFHLNCETHCDHSCHNLKAEIARLEAQLAKKDRILEEIRLQGDSPEWQHEICMSCLKLIPHNHANCYDCNKSVQLAVAEAKIERMKELMDKFGLISYSEMQIALADTGAHNGE